MFFFFFFLMVGRVYQKNISADMFIQSDTTWGAFKASKKDRESKASSSAL